jgi:eukaryotic-like serine/threonine-protein kinase
VSGGDPSVPLYGDPLGAGALVGPYLVDAALGGGGGGTVYRAHHPDTGAVVAVKVLHRQWLAIPTMVQRFRREARALARVDHPGVVAIRDVGALHDGRPYCVMEWLDGPDLASELAARGSLSSAELADAAEQIGAALAAVHRSGVIHRDVKPSNVVVVDQPCGRRLVLVDFGIARWDEPDARVTVTSGSTVGTAEAMAPEQIRGEPADVRTDVYAFGVMLFPLATGRPPFGGDPAEIEDQHLNAPAPRASLVAPVSSEFDAVVARCLAKRPADRYSTMDELLAALRPALAGAAPNAAICVGVHIEATTGDLDLADQLLERAAGALADAGLVVTIDTGNALLGVLRGDSDEVRVRAVACALQIATGGLTIRVHAAEAIAHGSSFRGGELFRLAAWPAAAGRDLVSVSPAAAPRRPLNDERLRLVGVASAPGFSAG